MYNMNGMTGSYLSRKLIGKRRFRLNVNPLLTIAIKFFSQQ